MKKSVKCLIIVGSFAMMLASTGCKTTDSLSSIASASKNSDPSKSILGTYQFTVTEPWSMGGRDCSVSIGEKEVKLTLGHGDALDPNRAIEVYNFELPDNAFKNFKGSVEDYGLETTLTEKGKDKPLSLQLNTTLEGRFFRVKFDHWLECTALAPTKDSSAKNSSASKKYDLSKSIQLGKYYAEVTEPFGMAGRDCSVIISEKEVKLTLGRDPLEPNRGIDVYNFALPDNAFKNFEQAFNEYGLQTYLTEKDKDKPASLQLNTIYDIDSNTFVEGKLFRVKFNDRIECSHLVRAKDSSASKKP